MPVPTAAALVGAAAVAAWGVVLLSSPLLRAPFGGDGAALSGGGAGAALALPLWSLSSSRTVGSDASAAMFLLPLSSSGAHPAQPQPGSGTIWTGAAGARSPIGSVQAGPTASGRPTRTGGGAALTGAAGTSPGAGSTLTLSGAGGGGVSSSSVALRPTLVQAGRAVAVPGSVTTLPSVPRVSTPSTIPSTGASLGVTAPLVPGTVPAVHSVAPTTPAVSGTAVGAPQKVTSTVTKPAPVAAPVPHLPAATATVLSSPTVPVTIP